MSEGTLVDQIWNVGEGVKVRFQVQVSRPLEGERWPEITPVVEAVERLISDWSAAWAANRTNASHKS